MKTKGAVPVLSCFFLFAFVQVSLLGESRLMAASLTLSQETQEYAYPFKDSLTSTGSFAVLGPKEIQPEVGFFDGIYSRKGVPNLEYHHPVKYSYWLHKDQKAPLIIIVPGLGGYYHQGSVRYLGEMFYTQGYHVLAVSNPFHWQFVLSSARSPMPGFTKDNVEDLYRVIIRSVHDLRLQGLDYTKAGVVGYSQGGLLAAHLKLLDQRSGQVGIERVLMINPPVDIEHGLKTLDALMSPTQRMGRKKAKEAVNFITGKLIRFLGRYSIKNPGYFETYGRIANSVPRDYIQLAFGARAKESLGQMIYVTQQIEDLGILKNKDPYDFDRLVEAKERFSHADYLTKFFFPYYRLRWGDTPDFETLKRMSGMKAIESELRQDPDIFLMHNADDFLALRDQDLQYLNNIFGHRATIYPYGGHVGNLWYPDNQKQMLRVFESLER